VQLDQVADHLRRATEKLQGVTGRHDRLVVSPASASAPVRPGLAPGLTALQGQPAPVRLPLLESLRKLRQSWPTRGWSWDSCLHMCVSSFFTHREAAARQAVGVAFGDEWSTSTVVLASPVIQAIAARTGGVRPGQRLFTSAPYEGVIGVGLWWPWGDRGTISLRIGLASPSRAHDLEARLRDVFEVTVE
jgi:hypothetical protein